MSAGGDQFPIGAPRNCSNGAKRAVCWKGDSAGRLQLFGNNRVHQEQHGTKNRDRKSEHRILGPPWAYSVYRFEPAGRLSPPETSMDRPGLGSRTMTSCEEPISRLMNCMLRLSTRNFGSNCRPVFWR